jgi:hypothetical protein
MMVAIVMKFTTAMHETRKIDVKPFIKKLSCNYNM